MLPHTRHLDAHVRWETTESDEELQQRIDNETDANTEFNAGLGADLPPRRRIGENTDEELSNSESDPGSMIVAAATSYRRGADLRRRHLSLGGPSGSSPREKANRRIAIYEGNLSPRTAAGPDLGTSPSMESASDDNVSRNNRTNPVDGAKGLGKSKQKRKQLQGSPASASLSDVSPVDLHTHTSAPNPPSQVVGSTLANFGSPYLDPRPLPPVDFPRLFEDTNPVRHDMWDKMDENHPAVVAARKKLDMNPLPDLPSPSWANDPVGGKGKGPAIAPGNKGLIGGPEAPHTNDPNPRRGHAKSMSEGTLPAQKTKAHPPDRVRVQSTATNQRPSRASKPTRGRGKPGERKRGQNEGNRNKSKPGQDPTGPEGRIPPIRIHGPTPAKPDGAPVVDGSPKEGHSPLRSKWGDKIAGWFGRTRSDSSSSAPELRPSLRATHTSPSIITSEMPVSEILDRLGKHGCKNITDQLDKSKFSMYPISSGGFGDVYRGSCHNGDRVAIKCLRLRLDRSEIAKKQLKHAARELYVWSRCNHPNVLGLTGMAQYRNQIAMVSPWTKYGNVRQLLSQLPQVDRYALCTQIIDGVAYLHSVGVVHGDLKGDNVLVSEDLTPKLTDFGNAALREYTLQFSDTTSRAGTSLNWVAPEILAEETGLTVEGDVYSLGMEVITGLIPYTGMREFIIMKKIANGEHPVRPEDLPPSTHYGDLLWSLLESCWAYDPKDRPTPDSVRDKANEAHHLRTEKGEINNRKIGSLNALYPVTAVQTSMNNHLSDQPSMRLRF